MKLYSETGRTNLGEYFLNYLREKQKNQRADSMRNVMLPPSLIPLSGVATPQNYFPPQVPNPLIR